MAAAKEEEAMMRLLLCSHGGRLVPCGPGGGLRYVGGETRALAVPRGVPFRELTAPLAEKAGAAAVTAVRYRLADEGPDEDLLVSVTSDEELAHMRDEYDRLRRHGRPRVSGCSSPPPLTLPPPLPASSSGAAHTHPSRRPR